MNHDAPLAGWTARPLPTTGSIAGRRVRLLPTDADRDTAGLYAAVRDGDAVLWDFLPYGPFADETSFGEWLAGHVVTPGLMPVTVIDCETDAPLGCASFMRADQENGVIEIGHIFFGAGLQRTTAATEAIFLMMRHAMDDLQYRRLEWKCDASNARSKRAAERFGFVFEGTFRQHKIVKGRNRDTAWFAVIDGDWPAVRAGFEAWLAPENFDADGRQLRRWEDMRAVD